MKRHPKARPEPRTPLYTSLAAKVAKAAVIAEHSRDSDGAYRTRNRKDGQE